MICYLSFVVIWTPKNRQIVTVTLSWLWRAGRAKIQNWDRLITKSRRNFYLTISGDWCGLLRGSVSPSRETNKYLCTIKNKLQPRRQFCKNCGVALRLNVRQSQTTARDVYRQAAKKQLNFNVSTLGGFRVVFLITKLGTRILVRTKLIVLSPVFVRWSSQQQRLNIW